MKLSDQELKERRREQNKKYYHSIAGITAREAYKEKNREKIKERSKTYENSVKGKSIRKAYKEKNRESIAENRKLYRKTHLENEAKYSRDYRNKYQKKSYLKRKEESKNI